MAKPIVTKHEPGHPDFDALETAKHLNQRIESFTNPFGLCAYWNAKKNRERLKLLPEKWKDELERRFERNLATLNNAGPY